MKAKGLTLTTLCIALAGTAAAQLGASQIAASSMDQSGLLRADSHPLSGIETGRTGEDAFRPSFQFSQSFAKRRETGDKYDSVSTLSGDVVLERTRNRLSSYVRYTGGATFSTQNDLLNTSFHTAEVSQTIGWRRWTFLLSDSVSYTPETPALSGRRALYESDLVLFSRAGDHIKHIAPEQIIFTQDQMRVSNGSALQVRYNFGPRTSITTGASYGFLRYPENGLMDLDQWRVSTGVDRFLNARTNASLKYSYQRFLSAAGSRFTTQTAEVIVARQLGARFKVEGSFGPSILDSPNMQLEQSITWGGSASMTYARARSSYRLGYSREVTGGSGVLRGANTDQVQLGISQQFGRRWSSGLNATYSNLEELSAARKVITKTVTGQISRALTSTLSVQGTIGVEAQSGGFACASTGCTLNGTYHSFSFGFTWHPRGLAWSDLIAK